MQTDSLFYSYFIWDFRWTGTPYFLTKSPAGRPIAPASFFYLSLGRSRLSGHQEIYGIA